MVTAMMSQVCPANDRRHEVTKALIKFEESAEYPEIERRKRLCRNCGLWDTYIQEEIGPEEYPRRMP